MAREEYIRIYRSDVGGATPSLTSGEIATNLIDGKFFIGGTNGSLITFTSNSYNVTSVNGLTGAVVSIATTGSNVFTGLNTFNVGIIAAGATFTGDIALQGVYDEGSQTTNKTTLTVVNPTANRTISLPNASGTVALTNATVASINGATGSVSLTGDGSNITITQSGNTITIAGQAQQTTAVTGDGAAIIGRNNAFVTARVGAYGATGVASFDPRFFVVGSSGHVVLTGSYQVTGDTVQAGTFINIGTGKVINNIGVQTFNGATGAVSFTVPLATTSLTGTASFNPNRFQVSATGNVDLITAYQVTGDTVQAGSFINIGAGKTINNIGVQTFNGLTGAVSLTGDSGAIYGIDNSKIGARIATNSLTGVASFSSAYFTVGDSGTVTIIEPSITVSDGYTGSVVIGTVGDLGGYRTLQITGDSSISVSLTRGNSPPNAAINTLNIRSLGVRSFNGTTGSVSLTGDGGAVYGYGNNGIGARLGSYTLTGVASFDPIYFAVGTSGHLKLATAYQVTGDTVQAGSFINIGAGKTINNIGVQTFNSLTGSVSFTVPLATTSLTGTASFNPNRFQVSITGNVDLIAAYQVTGDTIQAGSAINIGAGKVINNIGVTGIGFGSDDVGLTGKVNITAGSNITITKSGNTITIAGQAQQTTAVTGDGAAIIGRDNAFVTARVGAYGATGVASFDPRFFVVGSSGHVVLTGSYQVTGDTVQAGSGISIGTDKTITNIGVTGIGFGADTGLTGKINLTAGNGMNLTRSGNTLSYSVQNFEFVDSINITSKSIIGSNQFTITGGTGIHTRMSDSKDSISIYSNFATTDTTAGIAWFRDDQFIVRSSDARVGLAAAYQVTGDTIQAGYGINLGVGKVINNTGVTSFNGLTGNVSLTGDGGALYGVGNNKITARLVTAAGATGIASFRNTHFLVDGTGHVQLAAAYQVTGDTVQAGYGINLGVGKVINNTGVTSFNGLTGNVSLTGDGGAVQGKQNNKLTVRVVTDNAMTGVASFDASHFTVGGTGHVRSKGVITINSTSPDANGNLNFEVAAAPAVTGDSGAIQGKNDAFITARLATTEATGVAMFNDAQFSVNEYASVSLIYPYDPTYVAFENTTNVFTSRQYFNAGISADSIFVGSGITSIEIAYRSFQGDISEPPTSHSLIKSNNQNGLYLFSSGGTTASSITLSQSGLSLGHNGVGGLATVNIGLAAEVDGIDVSEGAYGSQLRFAAFDTLNNAIFALKTPSTFGSGTVNLTLPSTSGTLALVGSVVTSINGATGTVSITGDGGAVQGKENNKLTVRVVTDNAMTGVASFDASHFTVGGTGHVRSKGVITINSTSPDANGNLNFEVAAAPAVTGDGAAIIGRNNAFVTARLTTAAGATGVASFRNTHFTVDTTGHVQLAAAYQVTGDTVQAGTFINIGAGKVINNIGVQTFNGLTGAITLTGDGGALYGVGNNKITARLTTAAGATGVASFRNTHFTVDTTGHVQLAAAYQVTGDTIQAGSFINIGAGKTINNIGVQTFNGITGTVSLTGDGGAVRGQENNKVTVRLVTAAGATGVASFRNTHFTVDTTGHVQLAAAYQVTGDTIQAGSFINIGTGKTINNIGVQTFNGLTGAVSITGDGGAVQGKQNNIVTARLASTSLTGVAYFDSSAFIVTDGYVQLNGGGPGGACSDYTTEGSCEANGCVWCEGTQTCVQQFCNLFTAKNNGIGASANANGSLSYLYFDPGNLSAYTSDYSNKKTNYVLVYDESGTGISKARRATLENFFSENSALLKSSTTGQLSNAVKKTNALGTNTIELGVVLGSIAAGQEGLVKGASAFAYITQNTVKSINGATGDVMVVGDINGCTGAIVITGTTNEVVVTNSCPNITIGLPDNVSIPYLSGTGATFTQTVTATRFIGIVSGGDF